VSFISVKRKLNRKLARKHIRAPQKRQQTPANRLTSALIAIYTPERCNIEIFTPLRGAI